MTPVQRCASCGDELHKRADGKLVCLEKTCKEFKKEIEPEKLTPPDPYGSGY
jgi:hypothetical protein